MQLLCYDQNLEGGGNVFCFVFY